MTATARRPTELPWLARLAHGNQSAAHLRESTRTYSILERTAA
ncbi:hypothetical protein ACFVYD_05845 [Streptomyces sp. NPDC058301]